MVPKFFPSAKYRTSGDRIPLSPPSGDIPLSQTDKAGAPLLQDSVNRARSDGNADKQRRDFWRFFCYFLHLFLIALHVVLLVIATWNHAEHRITLPFDSEAFTTGLSGGLQGFYILYTALLVFVTQSLALSVTFSRTKKLTQIHDICSAWSGLGAALSTLWSQTKVASSVWSVILVTVYFTCVSVLHVASSTIMQLQPFNDTVTRTVSAVATWPGSSVNISALNWRAAVGTLPFLQNLYGNTTNGLVNNTLYDIPTQGFVNASVNATMVNAHCGLLSHLSPSAGYIPMSINVSMANMDPFTIDISSGPLLNEFWFDGVNCFYCKPAILQCFPCNDFIPFLVTAAIKIDGPVNDVNPVYFNGSYGAADQNISVPAYIAACTLSTSTNTATLSSSGSIFDGLDKDPTDEAWSTFSPGGDTDLTSTISTALQTQAVTAYNVVHCVGYLDGHAGWVGISPLQAYTSSLLGLNVSTCELISSSSFQVEYISGPSLADYTGTPSLLTRGQVERTVSQIATQFMWMAGQLGGAGGGFDRVTEDSQVIQYILKWRLNINLLPVIIALCASVVLCICTIYMLWNRHLRVGVLSSAGVLELMWLGSRSRILRDHLRDERNTSVDSLRASSMLETIFWPWSTDASRENSEPHATVPLYSLGTGDNSSGLLDSLDLLSGSPHADSHQLPEPIHTPSTSRSRRWCYALHIVLVTLHVVLLALLLPHPEHSIVIPIKTTILTTGLSAILQAVYTLYCAILIVVVQRLALFRIISNRRKLTTVHDVSGAWTGIGAAIHVLWQQRQVASSILEIAAVVAYLSSILILHIGSSSVLQWQVFNSTLVGVLPSDLVFPSSAVNISQLRWNGMSSVLPSISFAAGVSTHGLSNNTIYDIPRVPTNITFLEASVNATTLGVQCGLVPNITITGPTYDFVSMGPPEELYTLNFSLHGTTNGTSNVHPMSKGQILPCVPKCAVCPQTLFYMITTEVDVGEPVPDTVAANASYSSPSESGGYYNWTVLTHIAACTIGARTVPAALNLQENRLISTPGQNLSSSSTPWSVWLPADPTDFNVGMATTLSDITLDGSNYISCSISEFDKYMLELLWTYLQPGFSVSNSTYPCSIANPSVKLSQSQLEDAIAQTTAKLLWLSGQLGESAGGFQRTVGESQVTRNVLQWRLNLNAIPIIFVSVASFAALALVPFIIGKKPSEENAPSIAGTSVLECLWLEAHSDVLHSRMKAIEKPHSDRLRAGGMFDITLGDIGRSSLASEVVS